MIKIRDIIVAPDNTMYEISHIFTGDGKTIIRNFLDTSQCHMPIFLRENTKYYVALCINGKGTLTIGKASDLKHIKDFLYTFKDNPIKQDIDVSKIEIDQTFPDTYDYSLNDILDDIYYFQQVGIVHLIRDCNVLFNYQEMFYQEKLYENYFKLNNFRNKHKNKYVSI